MGRWADGGTFRIAGAMARALRRGGPVDNVAESVDGHDRRTERGRQVETTDEVKAFEAAVRKQSLNQIRACWDSSEAVRAAINDPIFDFDTPAIVWATGTGNTALIRLLVELGGDIDARSAWANGPYSALHHATGGSGALREGLARTLIELGATIDLHSAAGLGRLDLLTDMLDLEPGRISEPGPDGATPLHMARNPEVAAFLLGRGAPIDQPCIDHKSTPAMWAVEGRRDVTGFLVQQGARPDLWMAAALNDIPLASPLLASNPRAIEVGPGDPELGGGDIYIWRLHFASSPLEVARRMGSAEMHALLLTAAPPGLQMLEAAATGDLDELARLADAHPPGDLPGPRIREVLCVSVSAARIMLERGADPDAMNASGQTAMHHAAWRGDVRMLEMLLDAGANALLRDGEHQGTPLGWARHCGQTAAQRFLEERGYRDE